MTTKRASPAILTRFVVASRYMPVYIALIVLVLRMLLAQAVALDAETHKLQAELSQVI